MLQRLLKIALLCSVVLFAGSCAYRYQTVRCIHTKTVPQLAGSDVLTVDVSFTAFVAYIHNTSEIARTNNEALSHLVRGNVNEAVTLWHAIITANEPAVLNNYGVALILKGDFDTGYEYIYKAAAMKPDNPYFRKNYLYLHELKK